jgi:hypothetical protein
MRDQPFGPVPRLATATVLVCCALSHPLRAQLYREPPPVLANGVEETARYIVEIGQADELTSSWLELVFYAVADAISPDVPGGGIRGVSPYTYSVESTRTDKQLGTSASSSGTTSAVEKAGFPSWLAFAIENGAIDQTVSGTNLTLSTSPYALIKLWEPDTQGNFTNFGFWRRIGVSVALPMDNPGTTPQGTFDTSEISEWSVRLRMLGDRSSRSRRFTNAWQEVVQPVIQRQLNAITGAVAGLFNDSSSRDLNEAQNVLSAGVVAAIDDVLTAAAGNPGESEQRAITQHILDSLKTGIVDPIRASAISVSENMRERISTQLVPALQGTHRDLQGVPTLVQQVSDAVNRSPLLTLGFTRQHPTTGSATSVLKLLFDGYVAPFFIRLNGEVSLYDDPDPAMNQSTVRSFGAALEFQGTVGNGLFASQQGFDKSKVAIAVSGRVLRLEDVDDIMAVLQAKIDLPLARGLRIPFSVSYASRTDLLDEDEIRGNFGLTLDFDQLQAAARSILERVGDI